MESNLLQLFRGIESDDPIAVKAAIASGCDVNGRHQGETPLLRAVLQGKAAVVPVLLKHGADWKLVIVFPQRLKKTQIGKLIPRHKLENAARHYKLRLLARQLRSGSQP